LRLGILPAAGTDKKERKMSDWAQIAVPAVAGVFSIICEIIRQHPKHPSSRKRLRGLAKSPIRPEILEAEAAQRSKEWERNRNLALVLFFASVAIEIGLSPFGTSFLPRSCTGSRTPVVGISIAITQIPLAGEGGPNEMGHIAGKVSGVKPEDLRREDFRVVVYARGDHWYVQPFASVPITGINDNGTWENETHLGNRYAALLVKSSYRPPQAPEVLPNIGGDIVATTNMAPMQ